MLIQEFTLLLLPSFVDEKWEENERWAGLCYIDFFMDVFAISWK